MKICLVGTLPAADREIYTGPERTTIGLAEALQERGHEVTVLADEGDPRSVETPADVLHIEGSPGIVRHIEFALRAKKNLDPDCYDVIHSWRIIPNPDVLSLHSIGMAENVKSIFPEMFSRRFLYGAKIERIAKRVSSLRASETVVTAPKNVSEAEEYGFNIDRIIPVGVDESFLLPDHAEEDSNLLCLGRIEPRKQQHFITTETPEQFSIKIAGPRSDEEYAKRVPKLNQYWVGKLSPSALQREYQNASIFILPSAFEGFGLTAVEAMAAGTPVVAADTCGIADYISKHNLGTVYQFGDGNSYRNALRTVYADRDTYAKGAKSFVENNLIWSSIARSYEEIYASVGT